MKNEEQNFERLHQQHPNFSVTTEENQQIKQLQIEMKKLRNENSFLRSKVNFNKLKKPKTTQLKKLNESEENQPIKKDVTNAPTTSNKLKSRQITSFHREITLLPPIKNSPENSLYEMLQEYMVENEALRKENQNLITQQNQALRLQQSLSTQNSILTDRLEDMNRVMMSTPWMFSSNHPTRLNSGVSAFTYPPMIRQISEEQMLTETYPPPSYRDLLHPMRKQREQKKRLSLPRISDDFSMVKRNVKRSPLKFNSNSNSPPIKKRIPHQSRNVYFDASNPLTGSNKRHPVNYIGNQTPWQQDQLQLEEEIHRNRDLYEKMLSSKVYPFDLSNNNEFEKLKHHNPDIILPKEAYKASTIVIEDDINTTDVRKFSPGSWKSYNDRIKRENDLIDGQISSLKKSLAKKDSLKKYKVFP